MELHLSGLPIANIEHRVVRLNKPNNLNSVLLTIQILPYILADSEFQVRIPLEGVSPAFSQRLQPLYRSLCVSGKPERSSTCAPAESSDATVSLFLEPKSFPEGGSLRWGSVSFPTTAHCYLAEMVSGKP